MDGLAYSSPVYLQNSTDSKANLNSRTTQIKPPTSSTKQLTLLVQPLRSTQFPNYAADSSTQLQLVTIPQASIPQAINYHPSLDIHSMQGPNTSECFGHGDPNSHYYNQSRDTSEYINNYGGNTPIVISDTDLNFTDTNIGSQQTDVVDVPLDPYDNATGEQRFCGGYGEWAHVVNHTDRSILPDLKPHPFPDDIKNQADVIYNKMRYQVRRGKIRFQMLFFCVYCAHLELRRPVNPIQLGREFGLTQGEVQRCDSLFSPLQTGYKPPSTNTSPLGYLPDYCRDMNLSQEAIDEIMKMASTILRKDATLYQENPQTVAAGLLRYYTTTNGIITDDPQKMTRVTSRSNVTIDGMFRRISEIDNS